jgi:hypothetical protein
MDWKNWAKQFLVEVGDCEYWNWNQDDLTGASWYECVNESSSYHEESDRASDCPNKDKCQLYQKRKSEE